VEVGKLLKLELDAPGDFHFKDNATTVSLSKISKQ
jgi:hypothetical protein